MGKDAQIKMVIKMNPLNIGKSGAASINEFLATSGTPVNAVKSQGTLTLAATVTAEDSMVIGDISYTFKADGTATVHGDIDIGADLAATKLAVVAAIKGTDSISYANNKVGCAAAFATNDLVLTAIDDGAGGDTIATTSDFTSGSNVFDAVTLGTTTAGVNGTGGRIGKVLFDATNIYIKTVDNTGTGWRLVAHSDVT